VSAAIRNVASAKERATISDSLMDERMEFLDDFDLLMENASHSYGIQLWRYQKAQPVGTAVRLGTQLLWTRTEARKRASMPG
jgi:hypothetical protein